MPRNRTAEIPLDVEAFLAADFDGRIRLVNETVGVRLWSPQLAEIWTAVIDRLDAGAASTVSMRRRLLRELMMLAPDAEASKVAWSTWIGDVDAPVAPSKIVHLIISCEKYKEERAVQYYEKIKPYFQPIFIVLGKPDAREAIFEDRFLKVPAHDNYESLTWKVLEALIAVRRRFGRVGVLKLDDDTVLRSPPVPDRIAELVAHVQYAGHIVGRADMDRCWHAGKCEHQGDSPYRRRFHGPWVAGGRCYFGPDAVDALVREALFFPGEFEGELFEDKAMGDVLRRNGILPVHREMSDVFGVAIDYEIQPHHRSLKLSWTPAGDPAPSGVT